VPDVFVVFDLETTGFSPERHSIIEVGAIKFEKGNEMHQTFSSLVKTKSRISPKIRELTGIDKSMLEKEGREPGEVFSSFLDFISVHPIISYNYKFDGPFLESALRNYTAATDISNPKACALEMARRAWPGLPSYRLTDMSKTLGLQIKEEHRALDDAHRALAVYCHASQRLKNWK
jgi:DNA polymerase III epsilon subunit family exonuclease